MTLRRRARVGIAIGCLGLLFVNAACSHAAPAKPSSTATKPRSQPTAVSKSPRSKAPSRVTPVRRAPARPRNPTVELFHINHRETLRLRLYDDRGRPIKGVQARVNRFFRCHHTKKQASIDPRLVRLLYQVGRNFPGRRIEVVSGYRAPAAAKNPRSPHMKGLAADFRVKGVPNTTLRDYVRRTFTQVGVGYYPNSSFVHLDVRSGPSAFWIDYSKPGENALYSDNPTADLQSGKAESFKPAKIDPSWADDAPPSEGPDSTAGASRSVSVVETAPAPAVQALP